MHGKRNHRIRRTVHASRSRRSGRGRNPPSRICPLPWRSAGTWRIGLHGCPSWTLVCFGQLSLEEDQPVTGRGAEGVQLGQRAAIYARVSTADQCCERQIAELTAFAERGGFEVLGIFKETASGARDNRLARNRVLELAQARRIDAVLVTELSRWGRSTQDLLETLYKLAGWKVSVVAMSGMTFELDTPHGRMMATMLAGIAQFESDLLSERVKSGLAAARARGKKLGRQPGQRPKSDRLAPKVLHAVDGGRSYRWIARDLGISKNTVTDIVKRHRAIP